MADSLFHTATRRIRDASALRTQGSVSSRLHHGGTRSKGATTGSGLTRRERRVKAILLKELDKMNGSTKTWSAHLERKRFADGLDVAYIDRSISKMEEQLRQPFSILNAGVLVMYGVLLAFYVVDGALNGITWSFTLNLLVVVLGVGGVVGSYVYSRRATRRRLWIYQALRELSDADEADLQLDESVRQADLLIDRIIDQEDGAAPAPLHRIRTP